MGAIQFIENLDRTSLTITDEEFENNVEAAVSAIAERHQAPSSPVRSPWQPNHVQISDKSSISQPEVVPRNSIEAEYSTPRRSHSTRGNPTKDPGRDGADENTAMTGLLRTIQRPLSSLGRIFADESGEIGIAESQGTNAPAQAPQRLSPAMFQPPRRSDEAERPKSHLLPADRPSDIQNRRIKAEDAAARQASAEAAQARRIQIAEHQNVVESVFLYACSSIHADAYSRRTLTGMFPNLEKDVIDDVVRMKQGRYDSSSLPSCSR